MGDWIPVPDENVRISKKYLMNPTAASAVYDYGVIFPPPLTANQPPYPGLGFSLRLSEEERFDHSFFITAYPSGSSPGSAPSMSTGNCVNPILNPNQLEYMVSTVQGISGSPVWLGFRGHPTVVAIQYVNSGIL